MDTYCLFCRSGRESAVISRLESLGLTAIAPYARRACRKRTDRSTELQRLLPGYIFVDADNEPDWAPFLRMHEVYRVLSYPDGSHALRGADAVFASQLRRFQGVIEISKAIQVGTKVRFIDGPLRALAGCITQINKKRSVAAITFGDDGSLLGTVWCSMDIVASYAETEVPEEYRDALTQS